jgi:hypothetical protein
MTKFEHNIEKSWQSMVDNLQMRRMTFSAYIVYFGREVELDLYRGKHWRKPKAAVINKACIQYQGHMLRVH